MRVLYTHTSSLIGGGNSVLLRLFESLDRRRFQPVSVIPEPGPLEVELRRLEVPYVIVDLRPTHWQRRDFPRLAARLGWAALQYRVRLLHANDPWTYRAASLALWLPWIRRICHVHHPMQGPETLHWSLRRKPCLVITPSRFMSDHVIGHMGSAWPVRVETAWNPIDVERFQRAAEPAAIRARHGLDAACRHITILGALRPHKGHDCFLRMAALVRRRHPNTRFHVIGSARAGDQVYAVSLRRLVSELELEAQVRFWGYVDDATALELLSVSDLFVLPSREEGFGLSPAEAQACEVPVLSSAIRPLDEVIDDGRTGYLIPPGDHEQFAARAQELLSDEEARRRMGEAGRQWVMHRFSKPAFVRRLTDLYEEATAHDPGH